MGRGGGGRGRRWTHYTAPPRPPLKTAGPDSRAGMTVLTNCISTPKSVRTSIEHQNDDLSMRTILSSVYHAHKVCFAASHACWLVTVWP